ncbi:RNA polymerase sigma factor [Brevundimonas sp.]|uniref:RNA polymerase sigma factor n=1 Tax=Brevundimonas sp. TaxID=1871086 RepID=UPI002896506F|nr:RNA polymerase sigma factor [Brevundimonas sp.]
MIDDDDLDSWFCREVLPLERALTAFIRRNWRVEAEVMDLRQDIYERVLTGASVGLPANASAYVYTVARNHLITKARREQIVSIELVADMENITMDADSLTPERHASAREELRRVQTGLEQLSPRCREVVSLRKIEGLSSRDVAERLGIGVDAVDHHTSKGMRALVDFLLGGEDPASNVVRKPGLRWRRRS